MSQNNNSNTFLLFSKHEVDFFKDAFIGALGASINKNCESVVDNAMAIAWESVIQFREKVRVQYNFSSNPSPEKIF